MEAYSDTWRKLLESDRAHFSTALSLLTTRHQQASIKQYVQGNVLDLGAGYLIYRSWLEPYAERYLSLDVTPTHPELSCVGDGEKLPFATGKIDAIFCASVMEHTPHPWLMMEEMSRLLSDDGYLLLYVPFMFYMHGEPHDYYRFTRYALQEQLAVNNLEAVESGNLGGLLMFIALLFQNVLLIGYNLPLIGEIIWSINRLFSEIIIRLDRQLGMEAKFPIMIYVIARKTGEL